MALSGFAKLFRGTPVHPVGESGRMALTDHLRELRARILRSAIIIALGFGLSLVFFDTLFALLNDPYQQAVAALPEAKDSLPTTSGPGGGLLLYLKLGAMASVFGTSPYWLYQIWGFILPGLHSRERKWSYIFAGVAGPLFLSGIALGYYTLPKGLEVLIGFNPDGLTNLVDFNEYVTFFTRTLLVFGIALEIPLFVILLNMAGVVSGKSLAAYRPWIIIGVFVFAAVATPSADPFTMTMLAVPMVLLFFLSEGIARYNDRRRAKKKVGAGLSPDEASSL